MMRVLFTGLMLCLLTGCSLFPEQTQSSQQTQRVTADKLRLLQPGQWYRVILHLEKRESTVAWTEYIGQLQHAADDSITLTEVSKRARYESTSPLRRVPFYGRLYKNTGIDLQEEPTPKTLSRDQIEQIVRISAVEAAQLKQGFERIGVDFDFAAGASPGTSASISELSPAK